MKELSNNSDQRLQCDHCGLPTLQFGDPIVKFEKSFCCHGCMTIFEVLQEAGLQNFYSIRQNMREKGQRAQIENQEYSYFDHPDFLKDHVRLISPNEAEVTLRLSGIHCSACLWLIEKAPQIHSGITSARANMTLNEAQIRYNPQEITLSTLAAVFNSIGYPPRPLSHPSLQDQTQKKEQRLFALRLGVSGFCAGNSMMIAVSLYQGSFSGMAEHYTSFFKWASLAVSLPAVFFSAIPFYQRAWTGIKMKMAHMDLPISIAILTSFLLGIVNTALDREQIYFDSLTVLIFLLLLGRWIQSYSLQKVRQVINQELSFLPRFARLQSGQTLPASSVRPGDILQVEAGEAVPVDAQILLGTSQMDRAIITGESQLFEVGPGDSVLAGSINQGATLLIRSTESQRDSQLDRLEDLVHMDSGAPTRERLLVDRLSAGFTLCILVLALAAALYGSLQGGIFVGMDRFVALMVVACPCALGLATPLAYALSTARAMKHGIFIKGSDVFEKTTQAKTIVFDKTGTLTFGQMKVCDTFGLDNVDPNDLQAIARVEKRIKHPVASSIASYLKGYCHNSDTDPTLDQYQNYPGQGLLIPRQGLSVGQAHWVREMGIQIPSFLQERLEDWQRQGQSIVVIAKDRVAIAGLALSDQTRPELQEVITKLKGKSLWILSGDHQQAVLKVGATLGLTAAHCIGNLKPLEKERWVTQRSKQESLIYLGDGVNDSVALASAPVGIGLHGGASLTLKAAKVFFARPDLRLLPLLIHGARQTQSLVRRNLAFSLVYNGFGIGAAFLGYVNPLVAALLMPASSLTVLLSTSLSRAFRGRFEPWR